MAYIQFQLRRGTSTEWSNANPVLAAGEVGIESNTKLFKIGDGTTAWNTLEYGASGYSGFSGFSGYSGFSGISGYSGAVTYPSAGIVVSTGSTWGTSKTAPTGDIVGTTDTQTLSNKTVVALKETKVAMAANNVDLSLGDYFTKTISTTTTLTVSNVPNTGTAVSFVLDLTNGGAGTITWWSGMKWAGGTAPTLTASGRDVLSFFTHDGGTTWSGFVLGKDVK